MLVGFWKGECHARLEVKQNNESIYNWPKDRTIAKWLYNQSTRNILEFVIIKRIK